MSDKTFRHIALIISILLLAGISAPEASAQTEEDEFGEMIKKANRGDAEAMHQLGLMYTFGEGIFQDVEKGRYWLERANAKNNPKSALVLAQLNSIDQTADTLKTYNLYKRAAELGDNEALCSIADYYLKENGSVEQDTAKAIKLYEEAARKGYGNAYLLLANIYATDSTDVDKMNKVMAYARKALAIGASDAEYFIGMLYKNGLGTDVDYAKAENYLTKAAEKGDVEAMKNLGFIYINKDREMFDAEIAAYWMNKAAKADDAEAMAYMGLFYENGLGVRKDYKKAFDYYDIAINTKTYDDIKFAYYHMGVMLHEGLGCEKDDEKSLYILSLGTVLGDGYSALKAGEFLEKGIGTENGVKDYNNAFYYYRIACLQGIPEAMKNLANLLSGGSLGTTDLSAVYQLNEAYKLASDGQQEEAVKIVNKLFPE